MRFGSRDILPASLLALPFVAQAAASIVWSDVGSFGSPAVLFAVVVVAASLCVVTSLGLVSMAHRGDAPELSWIGLFFYSVSVLPLVHGLTTPGVLYGPNHATMASVALAIPVGLTAMAPLALGRHHRLAVAWRRWEGAWLAGITALAALMLARPNLIAPFDARAPFGLAVVMASVVACIGLGLRHVHLARIAGRPGPLVIAAGYGLVAGSMAVLFGATPYSLGFWLAHGLDIVGVFAATIGGWFVYRRSASMSEVLAPIVAVEPVAALEVGLHPDVVAFVEALDAKDSMTRDHVVRTAELAIEVASLMRLPAQVQRNAGLVGALHDIGKLRIPDEVLNKPGALNDLEWRIMRSHAAAGGNIVAGAPPLAELAPAVRAHHEHLDGGGYPDGLAGEDIPLVARIVAVCDAYDAMAYTRRYRSAMEREKVIAILREHAGSQWDPLIVQAVITIVSQRRDREPRLLSEATREERCDCLPDHLQPTSESAASTSGAFTRHHTPA